MKTIKKLCVMVLMLGLIGCNSMTASVNNPDEQAAKDVVQKYIEANWKIDYKDTKTFENVNSFYTPEMMERNSERFSTLQKQHTENQITASQGKIEVVKFLQQDINELVFEVKYNTIFAMGKLNESDKLKHQTIWAHHQLTLAKQSDGRFLISHFSVIKD